MGKTYGQPRYHALFDDFWLEPKLDGCSLEERGFAVFLFSNKRLRPSGIYRMTDLQAASDLAIPVKRVTAFMADLARRRFIVRDGLWIFVVGYFALQAKQPFLLKGAEYDVGACDSIPILTAFGEKYQHHRQWSRDRLATLSLRSKEDAPSPAPSHSPAPNTHVGAVGNRGATLGPNGRVCVSTEDGFDRFWALLPSARKVNKPDARKAWAAVQPDAALTEKILTTLADQLTWPHLLQEDFRYFPHPHRWLAKRRWEDEPGQPDGLEHNRGQSRRSANAAWAGRTEAKDVQL
jgi:hypothetical protein